METIDLNLLRVFVALKQSLSYSQTAQRLGVPRSTVSRAISSLEQVLGRRLFHRSTRSVALSSDGAALFERIAPRLADLQAALSDLADDVQGRPACCG